MVRKILFRAVFVALACLLLLGRSALLPSDEGDKVRAYTRPIEFDYVSWTIHALFKKIAQEDLGASRYLNSQQQHDLVIDYIKLVQEQAQTQNLIEAEYTDPSVTNAYQATSGLRSQMKATTARMNQIGPLVESILQGELSNVAASMGLAFGGELIPPVWYHTTEMPTDLIVSPRTVIQTTTDVSLLPGISVDQMETLEDRVSRSLDVSALVVPVGGIGVYPTMVMQTSDLNWMVETIAHEWTHNFLTLRPLGVSYDASPELRTMNETTASISGTEIGTELIRRYYPEFANLTTAGGQQALTVKPAFDFRSEMRTTRVEVDRLLAASKITQAESYMGERRIFFWENGYYIRKLNQAYFAFYGAYADIPGGAAGADPVGPAVRLLRSKSASLSDFLNRISWMTSFSQLQQAVR
ncbi:MAG: hypothetical protein M1281_05300 [Chloroflexi bacterium]|nr:hypothetical protein [Chloroflexota bacterium]